MSTVRRELKLEVHLNITLTSPSLKAEKLLSEISIKLGPYCGEAGFEVYCTVTAKDCKLFKKPASFACFLMRTCRK
jgi:hypothetical protein